MRIQITSIGGVTSKQGKFKPYKLYDLEFIDQESGREKKRQMIEFNSGAAFQKLLDAGIGSTWEVTTKPAKDPQYTDWVDATSVAAEEPSEAPKAAAAAKGTAAPFKSTYETPEERARKQVYIVRQSSITAAIALGATKFDPFDVADVLAIAKQFEAYVFGNPAQLASGGAADIQSDVPTVE